MTTPPAGTPSPLSGIDIGMAAAATRALLESLLDEHRITFDQWLVLNSVGLDAAPLSIDALAARFRAGTGSARDRAAVEATVRGTVAAGWVVPDGRGDLVLTAEGATLHARLTAGIASVSAVLYDDVPRDDLVVTKRVLTAVSERARTLAGR